MASAGTAYVDVEARVDELSSQIDDAVSSLDTLTIDVGADTSEAEGEIDGIDAAPVEVPVTADTADAQANIDDLGGSISALSDSAGIGGGAIGGLTDEIAGMVGLSSGATIGIGALAGGLAYAAGEAGDAQVTLAQLDQMVANMGDNANVTSAGLQALATDLQQTAGFSDEAVMAGEAIVLTFQNVKNTADQPIFDRAIRSAADLARSPLGNGDIAGQARLLARALEDPAASFGRLARSGVTFTQAQQDAIIAMQESGDIAGAQAALLDGVDARYGGLAETVGGTYVGAMDRAKEATGEAAEAIGSSLLPMLTSMAEQTAWTVNGLNQLNDATGGFLFSGPLNPPAVQSLQAVGTVVRGLPDALRGATDGTEEFGAAAGRAKDEIDSLSNTLNGYLDGAFALPEAQRGVRDSFDSLFQTLLTEGHTADDVAAAIENVAYKTADLGAASGDFAGAADLSIGRLRAMRDAGQLSAEEFDRVRDAIRGAQDQAPLTVPVSTPGAPEANRQVGDLIVGVRTAGSAEAHPRVSVVTERAQFDRLISDLDAADNRRFQMQVSVNQVPARAAGGPVSRGEAYLVGEEGPEMFVPRQSGAIIPAPQTASMMAGGVTIQNLNVSAPAGANAHEFAMAVRDELRALERAGR